MNTKTLTFKNITVIALFSKKCDMYLDSGGNPIYGEDVESGEFLKREAISLRNGYIGKRKKYTKKLILQPFSKKQLKIRSNKDDAWANREYKRQGLSICRNTSISQLLWNIK
jgi:hypothetical protein